MDRAGVGWGDLDAIAVGVGPGRLRACASGSQRRVPWRSANGLPLRRVSSLAALAAGIDAPLRLPLIDARRGELFGALYEDGTQLWPPFTAAPADLIERVREDSFTPLAAGDGSVRFRGMLEEGRHPGSSGRLAGPRGCVHCTSASWAAEAPDGAARGGPARLFERPRTQSRNSEQRTSRSAGSTYADLPQVIAIERRAFPTPWSLAMFVLELSKPSGICLAAVEDGELVGYLVCRATTRSGT